MFHGYVKLQEGIFELKYFGIVLSGEQYNTCRIGATNAGESAIIFYLDHIGPIGINIS